MNVMAPLPFMGKWIQIMLKTQAGFLSNIHMHVQEFKSNKEDYKICIFPTKVNSLVINNMQVTFLISLAPIS